MINEATIEVDPAWIRQPDLLMKRQQRLMSNIDYGLRHIGSINSLRWHLDILELWVAEIRDEKLVLSCRNPNAGAEFDTLVAFVRVWLG